MSTNHTIMFLLKLILTVCFISFVASAKILVFVPTPSISHQVVFRPYIKELINRRHEIVAVTTDPMAKTGYSSPNLTEIDLHDLSYSMWQNLLRFTTDHGANDMLSLMTLTFRKLSEIFAEQLNNEAVQTIIRDKNVKFDLLILEACVTPALILSHIYKVPVIQMSSFGAIPGNMQSVGADTHPFLYPTHYHQKLYNLTVMDKVGELYTHVMIERMLMDQEKEDDKMLRNMFGNDVPTLAELKNNIHMLFLNIHPMWLHNQPVPPNVVHIWGIHQKTEGILSEELQTFLDSSKRDVIYFSMGTNVISESIPEKKLEVFVKVFSRLPYNILWKWDSDEPPRGGSENIKISKWFPQSDLLRHPKVKLFITQGGLQSTDEAIRAGVPLIGIPMFADQTYNTKKYPYFKIGVALDLNTLSEENFEDAIKTVINDKSYRENIIQLRVKMHDHPQTPLERAIWWTEYVLRHSGAKHLRAPAANMSLAEYYELNLILVILSCLSILVIFLILMSYSCYTIVSRKLKDNKIKLS